MRLLMLCVVTAGMLSAQAMVEAGLGASRAATTAAPAAGVGKSIAGALSNLEKTLKSADKASSSETIILPKDTPPPAPAKTYEDIKKVEVGLAYDALIERFGPPSLEIAAAGAAKKLTYPAAQIEVKDGKVSSVQVTKPQPQLGVLTLK